MKKIITSVLLVLLASVMLISCGGNTSTGSGDGDPVVFSRNNMSEIESIDPGIIEGTPEHNVYMCLFEGLVSYDPETLEAVPGLAESWTVSEDALTWTFKLRKTKWSDGTKITAQTVVDSWLRFMSPDLGAVYSYLPAMIIEGAAAYNAGEADASAVGIRAIDDYTFEFKLNGPAPYALGMLSHYAFAVVPMHVINEHGEDWTKLENFVNNGPFTLESWEPNDKMVFTKSETYWDKENVAIDKVIFYPIEDENTALNMYQQGDLDWIELVPDARLDEMKLDDTYNVNASFITYYYQFNTTEPPFDDVRVREAFSISIDRQELVDNVTRGGQFPAYGITPPLAKYPAVVGFSEDMEKAKELLAEAGYPNGEGFPEINLIYNTSEGHKRIAEYVQQKWKEVLNVDITIENQEWATFIENRQNQNFQVARSGWQGDYVDPNTFLTDLLYSTSGNNDGKYSNPQFDALLDEASLMPDGQARYDKLREAEMIAFSEDMAVMPFYYYTRTNWIDTTEWGGWYKNVLDIHPIKNIYKK